VIAMDNILEHLLEIEGRASAIVNDSQTEADRRIKENDKKNRDLFDQRFKQEVHLRESLLDKEKERLKKQYQEELETYRQDIASIKINEEGFFTLFNYYFSGEN
jgi:vacuolar-type H+-ATPase subunit H